MKEKIINIMIALPRAGKSTFISSYPLFNGASILSSDTIRTVISGGNKAYFREEPRVWDILYTSLETLCYGGANNIVIDNTNLSVSYRRKITEIARKYGYCINYILVDTNIDVILERCKTTNFPIDVIWNMMKTISFEYDVEQYDNLYILNSSEDECDLILTSESDYNNWKNKNKKLIKERKGL